MGKYRRRDGSQHRPMGKYRLGRESQEDRHLLAKAQHLSEGRSSPAEDALERRHSPPKVSPKGRRAFRAGRSSPARMADVPSRNTPVQDVKVEKPGPRQTRGPKTKTPILKVPQRLFGSSWCAPFIPHAKTYVWTRHLLSPFKHADIVAIIKATEPAYKKERHEESGIRGIRNDEALEASPQAFPCY